MTILKKRLRRELDCPADHRGRNIVIEIEPPGLVSFREKGRHNKVTVTASWLYQKALEKEAERIRAERKKQRKAKHVW